MRARRGAATALLAAGLGIAGCSSDDPLGETLERAEIHLAEERKRDALFELRNALKLAPRDAALHFRVAELLRDIGNDSDATYFYEETLRIDPAHTDAALQLAFLLLGSDVERAEALASDVAEREPGNATARVRLSEISLVRSDSAAALRLAREATELEPESPRVWVQLGLVERARIREARVLGKPAPAASFEAAIEAFDNALEHANADTPATLVGRARIERGLTYLAWHGRQREALGAFQQGDAENRADGSDVLPLLVEARDQGRRLGVTELERWALERLVEEKPDAYADWRALAKLVDPPGADHSEVLARLARERAKDAGAQVAYAQDLGERRGRAAAIAHLESVRDAVDPPELLLATLAAYHRQAGDVEALRAIAAELRQRSPDHDRTLLVEARLAQLEGHLTEAAEKFRLLIERRETPGLQFELAKVELERFKLPAAGLAIDRALELAGPSDRRVVPMLRLRGRIEVARGDHEAAARTFRNVQRRRRGTTVEDVSTWATALYATGRAEAAAELLESGLRSDDPPTPLVLLFVRKEGERQPEAAHELLESALGRHPDDVSLQLEWARLAHREGRSDAALERVEQVLALHPDDVTARLLTARWLSAGGEIDRALEVVEAGLAREGEPDGALVSAHVALLRRAGRSEQARSELERVIEAGGASIRNRITLARLYVVAGRAEDAIPVLESVVEERADLPVAHHDLALLLATTGGDLDRALVHARAARAARPEQPEFADTLGIVHLTRSENTLARAQFDAALELAEPRTPGWARSLYHRALALEAEGRPADALDALADLLATPIDFPEAEDARALRQTLDAKG